MCFRKVRQKDVQRSIFHRGYEESKIAYVNPPGAAERLPLIFRFSSWLKLLHQVSSR